MINTQYKLQPVASIYRLLGQNFLSIFSISIALSIVAFLGMEFLMTNAVGQGGLAEIENLMQNPSPDFKQQSEAIQGLLLKYPNLVSGFLILIVLVVVMISYFWFVTARFTKNKLMLGQPFRMKTLIPDTQWIKILLYTLLCVGYFVVASGFVMVSAANNPFFGILALLFWGLILTRTILFVPGMVLGEMDFSESLKYSFQVVRLGRAFKIFVFGFLMFLMISFVFSALIYFPSLYVKFNHSKLYFNLWMMFLQIGTIGVGMNALFLRYANFEEQNIAE